MIRKSDIQWWVLEAKKQSEATAGIIESLAERLIELDAENERLRNEIIRLQNRGGQSRTEAASSAQVKSLEQQVETLQSMLRGDEAAESLLFLSDRLQSARLPLAQSQQMMQQGRPLLDKRALLSLHSLLLARPHQELLLLTSLGRGLKSAVAEIPLLAQGASWPTAEGQGFQDGERLAAALSVKEPPRFWTVATRRGYVQRFVRAAFDRGLAQGHQLVKSPLHNDTPVAIISGDRGDLLLLTRWGKGMRLSHRAIESQGSIALNLDGDDQVVAALALPTETEILIVTAGGYAMRRDSARIPAKARPGGAGRALIQSHDVLAIFPFRLDARLLFLTYSGKLNAISVPDLALQDRASKGVQICDMSLDPALAVVLDSTGS